LHPGGEVVMPSNLQLSRFSEIFSVESETAVVREASLLKRQ
jgi:hypothetical protein